MNQSDLRKPFWMVYGIGQRSPTVQHRHFDAALAESKRLARAHPGITFVVLESVAATVKNDVATFILRAPSDDIPF